MSRTLPAAAESIVVGAGMAGLAVAAAMVEAGGVPPVVLEAGRDEGAEHYRAAFPSGAADRLWLEPKSDPLFWRPYESDNAHFAGIAGLRRRVGGRSLYWHGVVLPIEEAALNSGAWPSSVVDELCRAWRGGESLYEREIRRLEAWAGRSLRLEPVVGPLDLPGLDFAVAPKAVRQIGGAGRWEAYSPLSEVSTGIVPEARVVGVGITDGRVTGVRVDHSGRITDVPARRVVLSASTIENSRLAIQALTEARRLDQPKLTGLVDKLAQGFVISAPMDSLTEPWRELAIKGSLLVAKAPTTRPGNVFVQVSTSSGGLAILDFYMMSEQVRGPWGEVRVGSSVSALHSSVSVDCGPADLETLSEQRELLLGVWAELQKRFELPPAVVDFKDPLGAGSLQENLLKASSYAVPQAPHTYSFSLGSEQHEAGTLPFGDVLTEAGEVRGVQGLYVSGPATFPRTGAANPSLTILALARRLGAHLADTQ